MARAIARKHFSASLVAELYAKPQIPHTLYLISGDVKNAAVARLRFARRWNRGTRKRLSAIHPSTRRTTTKNTRAATEKKTRQTTVAPAATSSRVYGYSRAI
jgi:hypothetical protein